jgi:hypothetical protein
MAQMRDAAKENLRGAGRRVQSLALRDQSLNTMRWSQGLAFSSCFMPGMRIGSASIAPSSRRIFYTMSSSSSRRRA